VSVRAEEAAAAAPAPAAAPKPQIGPKRGSKVRRCWARVRWRQPRAAAASGLAFALSKGLTCSLIAFYSAAAVKRTWASQSPRLGSATPDRQPLLCSRPVSLDPLQVRVLRPESYW
jgi:hypothetical protein